MTTSLIAAPASDLGSAYRLVAQGGALRLALASVTAISVLLCPTVSSAQWVLEVIGPNLRPVAINDKGDVAGGSDAGVAFYRTEKNGVTLLEGFPAGARATDINNRGHVVGILPGPGSEMDFGFFWSRAEGLVHLGTFLPDSINDRGVIAGSCSDHVLLIAHPCLVADGELVRIDVAPAQKCCSLGVWITEHGSVAGCGAQGACAFVLRRNRSIIPISTPAGICRTSVNGLSNRGEIVGVLFPCNPYSPLQLVLWDLQGTIQYTDHAGIDPFGINDRGTVVGIGYECGETFCTSRASAWTIADGTEVLPDLGEGGQALAINHHGDIAGVVFLDGIQHGAIWHHRPGHSR